MNDFDPTDTFDAELLPSGKRRKMVTLCKWCSTPIEQPDRWLGGMGWAHPDRYDVDCHGVECHDGQNEAEPWPT